jgi:HNH endonuclease
VTSDGTLIRTEQALALADQAEVYFAAVTAAGVVVNLGRSRRIATLGQTIALIARDKGCSFPGCDVPPEWCERHHIVAWVDGGPTNLDNLTLLCRYHHRQFLARGWTCTMNGDGLPEWRPPRLLDPQQRPLINTKITAAAAARRHRRMRT